jgi:hypothetical protein
MREPPAHQRQYPDEKGAFTVILQPLAAKCPEISPQRPKTVRLEKIKDSAKTYPSPKKDS